MKTLHKLAATTALAVALAAPGVADAAIDVGVEISFLADVSSSVDAAEFALQRDAYEAAFRSAAVINEILNAPFGAIAANFVYWSSNDAQTVVVPWTLIDSAASSNLFADAIAAGARPAGGGLTAPQSAIDFVTDGAGGDPFDNMFTGERFVIDISTDGVSNDDPGNTTGFGLFTGCLDDGDIADCTGFGRANAVAAGVDTINALTIDPDPSPPSFALVNEYASERLITADGTVFTANGFADFQRAIEEKIIAEVNPVPGPATLMLFGSGLLGLGLLGRRRHSA